MPTKNGGIAPKSVSAAMLMEALLVGAYTHMYHSRQAEKPPKAAHHAAVEFRWPKRTKAT